MEHGIAIASLMCHAPIVLPEIAKENKNEIQRSTTAMNSAARQVLEMNPETLIVLSPHTPRFPKNFGIVDGSKLFGDFSQFGSPELQMEFQSDKTSAELIQDIANRNGMRIVNTPSNALDHGALVPLSFFYRNGWAGKTVVIGFPFSPSHQDCRLLGSILKKASLSSSHRWAIIASGDMSHKLMPGAPAGFDPKAPEFDQYIVEKVRQGEYEMAVGVDPNLRELAAEDVVDSLEIATSAVGFSSDGMEYFSYEGPFGVGYLISTLYKIGRA